MKEYVLAKDWENPERISNNRLPARAYYIPFQNVPTARNGERGSSDYYKNLNGRWAFRWFARPEPVTEADLAAFSGEEPSYAEDSAYVTVVGDSLLSLAGIP